MVHALEITHSLLKRGGLLIDIHPSGQPPPVEVHANGEVLLAGHVQETDGFVEYFQADDALAEVTARGLFALERTELFPFMMHAPTVKAMVDYIEAEWSDAVLAEELVQRAKALLGEPGDGKEIVVREIVRISCYRSNGR
jgi:hypothetical protein